MVATVAHSMEMLAEHLQHYQVFPVQGLGTDAPLLNV